MGRMNDNNIISDDENAIIRYQADGALDQHIAPADYKYKNINGTKAVVKLPKYATYAWDAFHPNDDYHIDPREYECIVQAEPKEDFDKYYARNMMYFKNVAIHVFYDYMRLMNFVIDGTEKHSFAYHLGRAVWKNYLYYFIAFGIVTFCVAMLVIGK